MRRRGGAADLSTTVGSLHLPNPVMTASGTAGHADELNAYFPLASLGAVVVKSLASFPWEGNDAPRVHQTASGMLNAVGLQGPGVEKWIIDDLPLLEAAGVSRVVVSIWGRTVDEYGAAAALLAGAPPAVMAVEVNLSCPNLGGKSIFAHDPDATAAAIDATGACGLPRWAKLSPNTDRLVEVAGAAAAAGAEAVTLVNTVQGMVVDPRSGRPVLANGSGGLSGRAIHPVAVRAVWEVRSAHPDLPIVGVGGVSTGEEAAELLAAGAQAVQVGTATFADPRAPARVLAELGEWVGRHGRPVRR